MQSNGTLAELSLEGILDTVQKDRATGTLHIRSGDSEATLYFLFGHLFHAVDAGDQGEPVVHKVLDWSDGDFTFDAKAKLPAEETIKVSTAELLANRPAGGASSNGSQPAAEAAVEPEPEAVEEPATSEPVVDAAEPATAGEPEADLPATDLEPQPSPKASAEPTEQKRRRRTDVLPDTRPPETMILYPVPLGKAIHEGLTAGFVDFPKLLRSLAKDQHSGYVRLSGDAFTGMLLFSAGVVVEAIYDGMGQVSTGPAAFDMFGERIDDGDGGLDVIQLSPEMVTGTYQLLTANSLYEKLLARFIKADALLEFLSELGISGAVIVRHGSSTGVVLFREGKILGSYTDTSQGIDESAKKVVALCDEPSAEIEVRGGRVPTTLPVMELDPHVRIPAAPSVAFTMAGAPEEAPATAEQTATEDIPAEAAPSRAEETSPARDEATSSGGDTENATEESEGEKVDWAAAVNQMAGRADTVLGTRSKKIKELLYGANHNRQSIDDAIGKVSELSIMFVDPAKLSSLADELRQIAEKTGA